jgi:ribonuclease PH
VDGRSEEIQRLVARSLRGAVNLRLLGERTVIVDCDVIHADGGTRTAAINGGFVALALACRRLQEAEMVTASPIARGVAAVSVGLVGGIPLLDLDYGEDSRAETDMNLVMSTDGRIIEIQGTAERDPFSEDHLQALLALGRSGVAEISAVQTQALDLPR